jgi:hypothetical protein
LGWLDVLALTQISLSIFHDHNGRPAVILNGVKNLSGVALAERFFLEDLSE